MGRRTIHDGGLFSRFPAAVGPSRVRASPLSQKPAAQRRSEAPPGHIATWVPLDLILRQERTGYGQGEGKPACFYGNTAMHLMNWMVTAVGEPWERVSASTVIAPKNISVKVYWQVNPILLSWKWSLTHLRRVAVDFLEAGTIVYQLQIWYFYSYFSL